MIPPRHFISSKGLWKHMHIESKQKVLWVHLEAHSLIYYFKFWFVQWSIPGFSDILEKWNLTGGFCLTKNGLIPILCSAASLILRFNAGPTHFVEWNGKNSTQKIPTACYITFTPSRCAHHKTHIWVLLHIGASTRSGEFITLFYDDKTLLNPKYIHLNITTSVSGETFW